MTKLRKLLVTVLVLAILVLGLVGFFYFRHQASLAIFYDQSIGVSFAYDKGYQQHPAYVNDSTEIDPYTFYFQRNDPQAFLTVKYETGLAMPANILSMRVIDYVQYEMEQFFPVRYGPTYKSISTGVLKVAGKDAAENVFAYTDADGRPNEVRLVVIVWDNNSAYYFFEQSHQTLFDKIKGDLDPILKTLVLSGPK